MNFKNKFTQNTKVIGVLGHPIKHSYSPFMHNMAFDLTDLDYVYLPFDVPSENLKNAVKGLSALGIRGFNVTIPHKERIIPLLREISEEANIIGAVNTVINDNGRLHGYNTDVAGIYETLLPYKDEINNTIVTVIGAGGAARSVIYALIRFFKVSQINIINRTEQIAESMKEYFSTKMLFNNINSYELVPPDLITVFNESKLIINATSIGMFPVIDDSPTTIADSFHREQIVFDIVYNPLETKLLKLAKKKGARTLTGLNMFVEQGAKSYELWTNTKMPKEKIYKALQSYLSA